MRLRPNSGRATSHSPTIPTWGRQPAATARRARSRRAALAIAATLLASCAAPGGERYVYLESEAYRCGAAEGLGCGLALQPALAAIDEVEGVVESSAAWDGLTIRIELAPGADRDRVVAEARALLDDEACCEVPARGTASSSEPGRWYDAERTIELSRHEAGVIAADFAAQVASERQLEHDVSERIEAAMRAELERAFEDAHAAGGGVGRLWDQLPVRRFEARVAEFMPPEQGTRVMSEWITRRLRARRLQATQPRSALTFPVTGHGPEATCGARRAADGDRSSQ